MAFVDRATDLLSQVRAELSLPLSERRTDASDVQLQYIAQRVQEMKEEVLTGTLPPKGIRRYGEMGQFIVDSWALGSPLGTAVIALENEYRAL